MSTFSWKGWAELENDPAIFSTLLKEWGVSSVQVNEVVPLDSIFALPSESVYGLIFLSRWTAAETENGTTEAPSGVWFANQTSSFSCASVALINVINNHEKLDLGQRLNDFRAATLSLSPKDRGLALDQLDHVRDVHNSFATELDQLNVDTRLKEDALEAAKKQRRLEQEKKRKGKKRRKRASFDREDDEPGFHFIAYVPAGGRIWRMDGMEAFPRMIDTFEEGDSWLLKTINDLQEQWSSAESNSMEFSLLSLTARNDESSIEEAEKMRRTRENWGPFIAQMVQLHAHKGDLKSMML